MAGMLQQYLDEVEQLLFVPAYDEIHVGYQDRTCLTDEKGELLISPFRNGVFKPLVIHKGRFIAVLKQGELQWLNQPTKRLQVQVNEVIQCMNKRLAG